MLSSATARPTGDLALHHSVSVTNFPFTGELTTSRFTGIRSPAARWPSHYQARTATQPPHLGHGAGCVHRHHGRLQPRHWARQHPDRSARRHLGPLPTAEPGHRPGKTVTIDRGSAVRSPISTTPSNGGRLLSRSRGDQDSHLDVRGPPDMSTAVTDENGNTTTFGHDARGNINVEDRLPQPGIPGDADLPHASTSATTSTPGTSWTPATTYRYRPRTPARPTRPTPRTGPAADRPSRPHRMITNPIPAGQTTNPTELFTYTPSGGGVPAGLLLTHRARNNGSQPLLVQRGRRRGDCRPTRLNWSPPTRTT